MNAGSRSRIIRFFSIIAAGGLVLSLASSGRGVALAPVSTGDRDVFVPIAGCRLFDTRPATPVGTKHTKLGPGQIMTVTVRGPSGQCSIPTNATAVALTLAYASPTATSGLRAFAPDQTEPSRVDLRFSAGQASRSAAVTVGLSATGKIAIRNLAGSVHVIGDLTGYYAPHNHDDRYYTKAGADQRFFEGSTLVLVRADGTPADNGAALHAAMASITDASASKPYTLRLAPGVYGVGAAGLDVKPFVDIEGGGASQTVITAPGSPDLDVSDGGVFGTVRVSGRSELRRLTVRNTGGLSTTAIAVFVQGTDPLLRLTSMAVESSGGVGDNMGIEPAANTFVTDPQMIMNDVDVRVANGEAIGRNNLNFWDKVTVANSRLSVTGGGTVIDAHATNHTDSRVTVVDSTLSLDGGGRVLFTASSATSPSIFRNLTIIGTLGAGSGLLGLQVIGGDKPLIQGSTITLNGAGAVGINMLATQVVTLLGTTMILTGGSTIGISSDAGSPTAIVDASTIQADTILSSGDPGTVAKFGASKLAGTTILSGSATVVCVGSYKGNYTALSSTCT